jgi:anaerobic magnesium-protoporphyrin IX monomethyl ester cyclase
MHVTFIIPPSGFLLDERVFPSLGVLRVAAVLENVGVRVSVLDLSGVRDVHDAVTRYLDESREAVTAFGITATMPQMPSAAAIARVLRKETKARVILGGPHSTLLNASARYERDRGIQGRATAALRELQSLFDVVVAGDGEKSIGLALSECAPRVVDADDADSPMFLTRADLDEAPLPARHLIDIRSYRFAIDGVPTMSLIAQLGCPFGCAFCGGRRSPSLRRVRIRAPERVIAEMRHLHDRYGTRGFMFLDDELNVSTSFMKLLDQITALQDELGVEFRLRGLIKSELLTESMAAAMYRAGFRQLLVGFESGDDRVLLNMQKRSTVDDNTRCVETLRRAGLRVKALMSLGHAGESSETIAATKAWLLAVQPDDFDATIITVYPGTPYFDDAVDDAPGIWTYTAPKTGDRLHTLPVDQLRDANYYKGAPGAYQSFVFTDALSREELVALREDLEADVRRRLNIPFPTEAAALQFEHSMGQ